MPHNDQTRPTAAEPDVTAKPYVAPRLVVHGPIQALTGTDGGPVSILPDDN